MEWCGLLTDPENLFAVTEVMLEYGMDPNQLVLLLSDHEAVLTVSDIPMKSYPAPLNQLEIESSQISGTILDREYKSFHHRQEGLHHKLLHFLERTNQPYL